MASNDLDEHLIASLKEQGARIDVWGVGTRLVTGGDQAALGGVYKLGAVREPGGAWQHRVKVSEQAAKTSNPGRAAGAALLGPGGLRGRRDLRRGDRPRPRRRSSSTRSTRRAASASRRARRPRTCSCPWCAAGRPVYEPPPLEAARARARDQVDRLHPGIKRFVNPHQYPVGLALELHELKTRLVLEARGDES